MKVFSISAISHQPSAISLALLTGCAPAKVAPEPVQPKWYRYTMAPNAAGLAQAMASHDLKDPDSAKFRDFFFASQDSRGEARDRSKDGWCVEVNGKNGYGAYTGYAWAYEPPSGGPIWMPGTPLGQVAQIICSAVQYPPSA